MLLHGLTATRRNVVQGSRLLARERPSPDRLRRPRPRRVRPRRSPPPTSTPTWWPTCGRCSIGSALDRPVLIGSSMGAATAMAFALERPGARVARWCRSRRPTRARREPASSSTGTRWPTRSSAGASRRSSTAPARTTCPSASGSGARLATRQRIERHRHLGAVADAAARGPPLGGVRRSRGARGARPAGAGRRQPRRVRPRPPARRRQEYARRLPRAQLVVEEPGKAPLAWQGAQLSRAIAAFLAQV